MGGAYPSISQMWRRKGERGLSPFPRRLRKVTYTANAINSPE
jgi:hypothetical protein